MRINPLGPLGVEVDLDLSRPSALAYRGDLVRLFAEHGLLVFRGQSLEPEEQARVTAWFGPILRDHPVTYVSNVRPDGALGSGELEFHSDMAHTSEPFLGASLHAIDVADGASSTRFVDSRTAYQRLSDDLRERIVGLQALHVFPVELGSRRRGASVPDGLPRATHPLVLSHTGSGRLLVYVNAEQTDRIVGLPIEESEALLDDLFKVLYVQSGVHEHVWRLGDLVIYDNLALQHARGDVSSVGNRTLQRTTIARRSAKELYAEFERFREKDAAAVGRHPGHTHC